ncbi:hypothetical protein [Occultella kanbiaonis]|uniref:hypothetical protein n=1 Tax=Occultella kanbiaonis TaxID=2675754 RepID=UPI0012B8305B|nr:hypothetical protein [Occultella kanbiaonis]
MLEPPPGDHLAEQIGPVSVTGEGRPFGAPGVPEELLGAFRHDLAHRADPATG